jgi:hypothetical protein
MPKAKAQIGIVSIQKKYLLPFEQVQRIAIEQCWESLNNRAVMYDRATVEKYFASKGISPKTITVKEMIERGFTKDQVFETIKKHKVQPISTKGAFWIYPYQRMIELFDKKTTNK